MGSLFILVALLNSNHPASASSYNQPCINFDASLETDTSSSLLQGVSLHCGFKESSASENDSMTPLTSGDERQVATQHGERMSTGHDKFSGQFYIVMDDTEEISTITDLRDYNSSLGMNGNITVSFRIPRRTEFVGKFSCGYNSSNEPTNLTTNLVFAYVSTEDYLGEDVTFRYLFSFFFCFFVITLVLLIISCICNLRQSRKVSRLRGLSSFIPMHKEITAERRGALSANERGTPMFVPKEKINLQDLPRYSMGTNETFTRLKSSTISSCDYSIPSLEDSTETELDITVRREAELSELPDSFCHDMESMKILRTGAPFACKTSNEKAIDDFLKILSHPSPCLSSGCPCSYYKRKLLCNLRSTAIQTPPQRSYLPSATPDLWTELNTNFQGDLSTTYEVDQGYSSVSSQQPPTTRMRCPQKSQAVEIDYGYASVSSQIENERVVTRDSTSDPVECEHSAIKPQPATKASFQSHSTEKIDNHELCYVTPPAQAVVENEVAQRSSTQVDCHTNDEKCGFTTSSAHRAATVNYPSAPVSRLLDGAISPACGNLSSILPSDVHDISYPTLFPDTKDEVLELSNEFNLNMKYVDPIETVQFDSKGGRYANENHEVYLKVPSGAIPEGKTISIEVGVSFHSALVSLLPLESRPVSPLVKLCVVGEPNFRFLKPVEVILPHFLDIEDKEDPERMGLQFVKSGHSLYCFHKSDGVATFMPHSHTATLKTAHFCTFCITADETISSRKINYRLVKVVPKNREEKEWRAHFCVAYYLRTCLQVSANFATFWSVDLYIAHIQALKKQFPDTEYDMKTLRRFKFGESAQLKIYFERKLAGGWQMALESGKKVVL